MPTLPEQLRAGPRRLLGAGLLLDQGHELPQLLARLAAHHAYEPRIQIRLRQLQLLYPVVASCRSSFLDVRGSGSHCRHLYTLPVLAPRHGVGFLGREVAADQVFVHRALQNGLAIGGDEDAGDVGLDGVHDWVLRSWVHQHAVVPLRMPRFHEADEVHGAPGAFQNIHHDLKEQDLLVAVLRTQRYLVDLVPEAEGVLLLPHLPLAPVVRPLATDALDEVAEEGDEAGDLAVLACEAQLHLVRAQLR
mmetsp:Transcript_25547/g.71956  ORF Transcript_25547/g.71956 Transcript_25547/m.71956 type:complete len:248 (-) Transcript_25547:1386-2129(-)